MDGRMTEKSPISQKEMDALKVVLSTHRKRQSRNEKVRVELLAIHYEMQDYLDAAEAENLTVGYFLRKHLETLNIKQNKFAEYIGLKPSNFNKILNGERKLNHELAMILGRLFGQGPGTWMEIQLKSELQSINWPEKELARYKLEDLLAGEQQIP